MTHISWSEIAQFNSVRKSVLNYPELLNGYSTVSYKFKTKLHGTNAGIQIIGENLKIQSRERLISETDDNYGFAKWVSDNAVKQALFANNKAKIALFGEWFGKGIQSGVAASQLPGKYFGLFAAVPLINSNEPSDELIIDPNILKEFIKNIDSAITIPWLGDEINVNLTSSAEDLKPIVNNINELVKSVELEDPLIKEFFNISGLGEGVVAFPTSKPHLGRTSFSNLSFKSKGEKHRTIAHSKPAQIDFNKVESSLAFASLVCTQARLEQGLKAISGGELLFNQKLIGPFLAWMLTDIKKECSDELEASNLKWEDVKSHCQNYCRQWFISLK